MDVDAIQIAALKLVQRIIKNRAEHIEKKAMEAMNYGVESRSLLGQSIGLHHAADEIQTMIELLCSELSPRIRENNGR